MRPENDLNFEMGHGYGELYTLIAPPAHGPWLAEVDFNCFWSDVGEFIARVQERAPDEADSQNWCCAPKYSLEEWQASEGFDQHSRFADPLFIDAAQGDYRVQPDSPALALGFVNFDPREAGLTAIFRERSGPKHHNSRTETSDRLTCRLKLDN